MFRKIICCISIFILISACCLVPTASAESVEYNYLVNMSDISELENYSDYPPKVTFYYSSPPEEVSPFFDTFNLSLRTFPEGVSYYAMGNNPSQRSKSSRISFSISEDFSQDKDFYFDFYICTYNLYFATSIDYLNNLQLQSITSDRVFSVKPSSVGQFSMSDSDSYFYAHFNFVLKSDFFSGSNHQLYFDLNFEVPLLDVNAYSGVRFFIKPGTNFIIRDYTVAEYQSDLTSDKITQGVSNLGSNLPDPELPSDDINHALNQFDQVEENLNVDYPFFIDFLTNNSSFIESSDFLSAGLFVKNNIEQFLNENLVISSFVLFSLSFSLCIFVLGRGFK